MPPSSPTEARANAGRPPIGWAVSKGPVGYELAVKLMEARVAAIADGRAPELVWLLEHPPLYTAGVSAKPHELLSPGRLPVFASGRGGRYTYHGPGQRVAYVLLDLRRRGCNLHAYVRDLERWLIETIAVFGVSGETRCGRVGVWVARPGAHAISSEAKIAAIGVKVRRWVTFHGVSLNVSPDLSHFEGIVPCGLDGFGVTSLADLGRPVGLAVVDEALRANFEGVFGPLADAPDPVVGRAAAVV